MLPPIVDEAAVDMNVSIFLVEVHAFVKKVFKGLVIALGKSACCKVMDTFFQCGQRHLQENHNPVGLQVHHGRFAVGGAATGGDDVIVKIEAQQDFLLDPSQFHVSAFIHDILKRLLLGGLDRDIGVDKRHTGQLGEDNPNGTFAGTGHADQDNVLVVSNRHGGYFIA